MTGRKVSLLRPAFVQAVVVDPRTLPGRAGGHCSDVGRQAQEVLCVSAIIYYRLILGNGELSLCDTLQSEPWARTRGSSDSGDGTFLRAQERAIISLRVTSQRRIGEPHCNHFY